MPKAWRVRLSAAAEDDVRDILAWTTQQFGQAQARAYQATLVSAISALTAGPGVTGARPRHDLASNVFTLHAARAGRRARHVVVFRAQAETIDILRVLRDAMDLARHIPED